MESIQTNHKTYFNDDKLVFRTRLGGCRERFRLRSTPIDEYLGASPVFPTLFEENRLNKKQRIVSLVLLFAHSLDMIKKYCIIK